MAVSTNTTTTKSRRIDNDVTAVEQKTNSKAGDGWKTMAHGCPRRKVPMADKCLVNGKWIVDSQDGLFTDLTENTIKYSTFSVT